MAPDLTRPKKDRLKICYLVDAGNVHSVRWIEPFVARGHEVHVVSFVPCARTVPGAASYVDLTTITNTPKVRFARWGWWIYRYIQRLRPHILHAHQLPGAGWLGVMANYHPFVVSAWGSDLLVEPHKSRFRRLLLRLVLQQSDQLTVPSAAMAAAARRLNVPSDRLQLVPWGVETAVFSPAPDDGLQTRLLLGLEPRAPVLLAPRRIAPLYHIHTLIAAVQRLIGQFPSLQLALVRYDPDAAYMARIEQEIAALGLGHHVSWLPAQNSQESMARLYRMADIVLSIPASEGYGSTVYEALACGTPAIVTDLPVFEGELVDGLDCLKVPVGDAARTAEAVARLVDDRELYRSLAANGLEIARDKSVSDRVEQVESLYKSLVAPGDLIR